MPPRLETVKGIYFEPEVEEGTEQERARQRVAFKKGFIISGGQAPELIRITGLRGLFLDPEFDFEDFDSEDFDSEEEIGDVTKKGVERAQQKEFGRKWGLRRKDMVEKFPQIVRNKREAIRRRKATR